MTCLLTAYKVSRRVSAQAAGRGTRQHSAVLGSVHVCVCISKERKFSPQHLKTMPHLLIHTFQSERSTVQYSTVKCRRVSWARKGFLTTSGTMTQDVVFDVIRLTS
jgi:hypothetical protein